MCDDETPAPAAQVPLLVDGTPINPVQSVRDLGMFIDADLVMRTNVQKTVCRCFTVLRQLHSIRHSVPATTFQTLIVSLVLSRLDYGNAVLARLPAYLFRCLQSMMNAATRLIYGLRHSDHISDALISLHWIRAQESTVQDGRAHVQGHTRNCAVTVIPESTGSCRRSAWSTFPPLCSDQSSAGTVRETVYRRRPGLPGGRTHHLEQPAGQRDICPISVNLPSAFKNISVPGLVP